jgi:hypothetical protein
MQPQYSASSLLHLLRSEPTSISKKKEETRRRKWWDKSYRLICPLQLSCPYSNASRTLFSSKKKDQLLKVLGDATRRSYIRLRRSKSKWIKSQTSPLFSLRRSYRNWALFCRVYPTLSFAAFHPTVPASSRWLFHAKAIRTDLCPAASQESSLRTPDVFGTSSWAS